MIKFLKCYNTKGVVARRLHADETRWLWQKRSSDTSRATCLGKIGASYNGIRRWSEAQHWLKHALALDPRHVGAAYRLNLTYIASTGDIQRAKRAWEEYGTTKQTWAKVRSSPMRS